jgi:diadenosine tetraphosphate (Ap4A) HIT family hydrolase
VSDSPATDCFVCRKHRGDIPVPGGAIYEDALVYAGHAQPGDDGRAYLGHLVAEPKRNAPGLADLTDDEARALGLLTTRLSRALRATLPIEHVYLFVLGHAVEHLHLHVVPRHPGAPCAYWGARVDEWPEAPRGDPAEITALCARVARALP